MPSLSDLGVKALSFDLDDTLYLNTPYIVAAEKALRVRLIEDFPGLEQLSDAEWSSYRKQVASHQPTLRHDVSAFRRAWLQLLLEDRGCQEASQRASEYFDFFLAKRSDFKVAPEVCAILKDLAKRYKLCAITNGNVDLVAIGIADCFEFCLKANLQHRAKPEPDMFEVAAQRLDLAPAQIAHIGDHLVSDVAGAKAAGYQAIWYNHLGQTELADNDCDFEIHYLEDLLKL